MHRPGQAACQGTSIAATSAMDAIVISPHLDDAVLGCGTWLAAHPGAVVITVFAGAPADARHRLTEWDAACGFSSVAQAMQARRREDLAALTALQAHACWLEFLDSQYLDTPAIDTVATALVALLGKHADARVLLPLGLFHSDHLLTHAAAWRAVQRLPGLHPWAYEDVPYRARPGVLQQRLAGLRADGWQATPCWQGEDVSAQQAATKAHAVAAYASQARALGTQALADARRPERFWALETLGQPSASSARMAISDIKIEK